MGPAAVDEADANAARRGIERVAGRPRRGPPQGHVQAEVPTADPITEALRGANAAHPPVGGKGSALRPRRAHPEWRDRREVVVLNICAEPLVILPCVRPVS